MIYPNIARSRAVAIQAKKDEITAKIIVRFRALAISHLTLRQKSLKNPSFGKSTLRANLQLEQSHPLQNLGVPLTIASEPENCFRQSLNSVRAHRLRQNVDGALKRLIHQLDSFWRKRRVRKVFHRLLSK